MLTNNHLPITQEFTYTHLTDIGDKLLAAMWSVYTDGIVAPSPILSITYTPNTDSPQAHVRVSIYCREVKTPEPDYIFKFYPQSSIPQQDIKAYVQRLGAGLKRILKRNGRAQIVNT